jgi:hypothetical protein
MGVTRYIFRIVMNDTEQPGSKPQVAYVDKKSFTIGSGANADVKVKGMAVESQHLSIKIDGQQIMVKNQGRATTMVGTYKIPSEAPVEYKPGEGLKLGLSKIVVQVELFKKFTEAHEESDAIIREAMEKAKQAEALVATQRQVLAEQNKVAEETSKQAQSKADEIKASALKTKEQILKAAEQDAAAIKQRAEQEAVRSTNENNLLAEEKAKAILDQAKDQAKEIKKQAQKESDILVNTGKSQAQEQIDLAARKAEEYLAESKREFKELQNERKRLEAVIAEQQLQDQSTGEKLASLKKELKKFEEIKLKAQIDLDAEKERIRLSQEELQKQFAVQLQEKQSLNAEIESMLAHFNRIKGDLSQEKSVAQKELQRCKTEATEAVQMKEQAEYLLQQHNESLQEIKKSISSLHHEQTNLAARINAAKDDEMKEREEMRNKLNIEYWKRRELEEKWFTQQREQERVQKAREKAAKQQIEADRLSFQITKISQKLKPLISLELTGHLSEDQLLNLEPELEKIVASTVEQAVNEEYEFRRENWQTVKLPEKTWKFPLEPQDLKLLGVTTLSFLVILAAVFSFRSSPTGSQARVPASQAQAIVYSK